MNKKINRFSWDEKLFLQNSREKIRYDWSNDMNDDSRYKIDEGDHRKRCQKGYY